MIRTEANGATLDNKYTEGNAGLGIPATVVGGPEMNSIQEELANAVERYGISLLTRADDTMDQLYKAMELMHSLGGRPSPVIQSIVNNQAAPADVVGFPQLDTALHRAVEFFFTTRRKTDTNGAFETGRGYLTWDTFNSAWLVSLMSVHDGAGVTFSIASVSGTLYKLQYVSDNITGTSYTGQTAITDITFNRVS